MPVAELPAAATGWPDTPRGRADALAALRQLDAELLSHDSATLTLEAWCADHRLGTVPIVAERQRGIDKPATPAIRASLDVAADTPVAYRRVRLRCGERVLSEADNWYVPDRLTPAMNQALQTSDISFGHVVAPLRFRRRTLSSKLLWMPIETARATLAIPDHVLEHRALLVLPGGAPISLVVEDYTAAVLDFAPPAR